MKNFFIIFSGILCLALFPLATKAQKNPSTGRPLLFSADELVHDKERSIVTASGSVEVSQDDRVLLANSVSYNQTQNIVTARGQVSLLEPSGNVLFGEFMELTGDLKDGIIRNLRIRLSDNSRIAATGARRSAGVRTEMRNVVYSPCKDCANQTVDKPLWQLKAIKVVHDEKEKVIEYSDAFLEIFGVPIAYTPFFSHPDPTIKRKSGFLTPRFGGSTTLGTTLVTPYFFDISPNKDLTVTPSFTSKERVHLAGEYRELGPNARLDSIATITLDSNDELRGHIDTKFRKDINDTWRAGFDLKGTTDDTYLRRYKIGSPKNLTSRAFGEAFRGRDYLKIDSYFIRGLQEADDPGQTPIVAPMIDFSHISKPNKYGITTSITANALALTRTEGSDTKRLSLGTAWHLPRKSSRGAIIDINLSVRGDMYHVTNLTNSTGIESDSSTTGRIFPRAALNWRYPLSKQVGQITQILEPVTSFLVSPYGGNPNNIPNEDSIDLEFDDTNLFSPSRFTGIDLVEGGPRFNYGLKWAASGKNGGNTSLFLGQSYRIKSDDTFVTGSGLENNFSDIVGRANLSPGKTIDLTYRTRLEHEDFSPRRNEVQLAAGPPALRINTNYLFFDTQQNSEFGGREEVSSRISSKLTRLWRSSFSARYDLQDNNLRSMAFNVTYECECFTFSTIFRRDFFEDRDLKPSATILFQLSFKTLGDVQTGISQIGP